MMACSGNQVVTGARQLLTTVSCRTRARASSAQAACLVGVVEVRAGLEFVLVAPGLFLLGYFWAGPAKRAPACQPDGWRPDNLPGLSLSSFFVNNNNALCFACVVFVS